MTDADKDTAVINYFIKNPEKMDTCVMVFVHDRAGNKHSVLVQKYHIVRASAHLLADEIATV